MAKKQKIEWGMSYGGETLFRSSGDDDLSCSTPFRDCMTYPYSYDPFTIWGGKDKSTNGSVWTDRMRQWDSEKFQRIGNEVFETGGDLSWFKMGGAKVQEFLQKYTGKKLILTRIVEYCNVSSGYPVWYLAYHDPASPVRQS